MTIQRYEMDGQYDYWAMEPDKEGKYVLFSDHEAAVAAARAEGMRAMAAIAEDVIESQNWTRGGVTDAAMEDMLGRIKASTPEATK